MTNYAFRARSTTPGDYNFVTGRLLFVPPAASVLLDVDRGDGSLGALIAPTAAEIAAAVWKDLLAGSDFGTTSSIGNLIKNYLDAAISSRMATYTQPSGFLAATFPTTVASTTNITAASGVSLAADQAVNVTKWGGTAIASAYVQANAAQFGGQAVTASGGVTVGAYVGNAAAALSVNASGQVTVGGYGTNQGPLYLVTGGTNTIAVDAGNCVKVPDAQKVDLNTIKTQAVTCGAGVTVGAYIGNATHAIAVDANGYVTYANAAPDNTGIGNIYAIVNHTDYGNAKLVRSTTPANTLTVDANHLVAVPTTQKVDLVDAPNATAVTAIQLGLSKPGTAQTITANQAVNAAQVGGSAAAAIGLAALFANAIYGTAQTGGSSTTIKLQAGQVCQSGDMITWTNASGGPDTKAVKTFDAGTNIATMETVGWRGAATPGDTSQYLIFGRVSPP